MSVVIDFDQTHRIWFDHRLFPIDHRTTAGRPDIINHQWRTADVPVAESVMCRLVVGNVPKVVFGG